MLSFPVTVKRNITVKYQAVVLTVHLPYLVW